MSQSALPKVNLDRWRPHVLAALQSDLSIAAYARLHHLSKHTLYIARMAMQRRGEDMCASATVTRPVRSKRSPKTASQIAPAAAQRSAFVAVAMTSTIPVAVPLSLPACAVQLPNGLRLQFEARDAVSLQALLQALVQMPCLR